MLVYEADLRQFWEKLLFKFNIEKSSEKDQCSEVLGVVKLLVEEHVKGCFNASRTAILAPKTSRVLEKRKFSKMQHRRQC